MAECPSCRRHWRQMKATLQLLHKRKLQMRNATRESIWPMLSVRLASRIKAQQENRFNGWLPGLAVAAACLIMVTFTASYPPDEHSSHHHHQPIVALPASMILSDFVLDPAEDKGIFVFPADSHSEAKQSEARIKTERPYRSASTLFEF